MYAVELAVELAKAEWLQSQLVASRKDMKLHTFFSPDPSTHQSTGSLRHRPPAPSHTSVFLAQTFLASGV